MGNRWIVVISAPESVVGSAQTRPPRTAAIAFAVSITLPPPSATRVGLRTESMIVAAASGTKPLGTSWTALASSASSSGAAPSARGVVTSSKRSQIPSARSSGASASAPSRKTTVRSPSRQVKSRSSDTEPAPGFEPGIS